MKQHEQLRRRLGFIVIVALLVPIFLYVRQNAREAAVRDSITFMNYALSGGAKLLHDHRERYARFPPRETSGSVYLPLTRELVRPVDFDALTTLATSGRSARGTILYSGPPIDPYRAEPLFAGESRAAAVALGHDGNVGFHGYPLRYCRVGGRAVLISNGPDRDVDITIDDISQQPADGHALPDLARTLSYDPTNGTLSSGDCMRVVEPSQDW